MYVMNYGSDIFMYDNFKLRIRVRESYIDMYARDIDDLKQLIDTYQQRIIFIENLKVKI